MAVDFTISHDGQTFELTMVYPKFFPDTPPQVKPRGDVRLSQHQYGSGGEFCLEFRPDNWDPSWTGAMMIESAHRLLSGEMPSGGEAAVVPNAHRETLGQSVRLQLFRFPLLPQQKSALLELPTGQAIPLQACEHLFAQHWMVHLTRLGEESASVWSMPQPVRDAIAHSGFAVRLSAEESLPSQLTRDYLRGVLLGLDNSEALGQFETVEKDQFFLLFNESAVRIASAHPRREALYNYAIVEMPADVARLPAGYGELSAKSVGVVGCGSVGSKVAMSLARAGIGKFVLVDGDVLTPGNLVRNDLDFSGVGVHKADALATRILDLNGAAEVIVRKMSLGEQESAAATDYALQQLAQCDLIVEATADPEGFNLAASVARRSVKPMVWAEVFAGGIGGIIARARPEFEPPPHVARRQIAAWCDEYGAPWHGRAGRGYDLETDAQPLVANDADVTVIAGHLSRFALDALLRQESVFASSAYAIGMDRGWIFEGPFDTYPIGFPRQGEWGESKDEDFSGEFEAMTKELFPQLAAESDAA